MRRLAVVLLLITLSPLLAAADEFPELAALEKAAQKLNDIEMEWYSVNAWSRTGEIWGVSHRRIAYKGEQSFTTGVGKSDLPELKLPTDPTKRAWYEKLDTFLANRKPFYCIKDGKRYTTYNAHSPPKGADYLGMVERTPPANNCEPIPWVGTYLSGSSRPIPLGTQLKKTKLTVLRVRTKWGQTALVRGGSKRWPKDTSIFLFDMIHKSVPAEKVFTKQATLKEVAAYLRECKSIDHLRKWKKIRSHRRVLEWMTVKGLPVLPRIIWSKAYRSRSRTSYPHPAPTQDQETLMYVTSVRKGAGRIPTQDVPDALKDKTVDLFEERPKGWSWIRRHPDGRREKLQ